MLRPGLWTELMVSAELNNRTEAPAPGAGWVGSEASAVVRTGGRWTAGRRSAMSRGSLDAAVRRGGVGPAPRRRCRRVAQDGRPDRAGNKM